MRKTDESMKNSLNEMMRHLHCLEKSRCRERFEGMGLTEGQPKVLGYLSHHNGCIQRELADNCHVRASTVTSLLANMERDGLIYRSANPDNRRILNVFLDEKGEQIHQGIVEVFHEVDEECLEGFDPEERQQVLDFFYRMCMNLEKRREASKND